MAKLRGSRGRHSIGAPPPPPPRPVEPVPPPFTVPEGPTEAAPVPEVLVVDAPVPAISAVPEAGDGGSVRMILEDGSVVPPRPEDAARAAYLGRNLLGPRPAES